MSSGKYFQGPLCLLAYSTNFEESLRALIKYSIANLADSEGLAENMEPGRENSVDWPNREDHGWDEADEDDARIGLAANIQNVVLGKRSAFLKELKLVRDFVQRHEQRFGPDRKVRLAARLVWECIDEEDPAERERRIREVRILAGVFAALGARDFRLITRDEIIRGSCGCKSKVVFDSWKEKLQPFTTDQIRWTLRALENRQLFVRCCPGRRHTYFAAASYGHEQLREAVVKLKASRDRVAEWRRQDRAHWQNAVAIGAGDRGAASVPPRASSAPPARDPVTDALAVAGGGKVEEVTDWKPAGIARAAIIKVMPDVTPEEIRRRAINYRTHFDGAALTPTALAKHWAVCASPKPSNQINSDKIARERAESGGKFYWEKEGGW